MAIQAKLFDGTILQFPDGTDPSVIDKVAAEETSSRQKATAPTEEKPKAFEVPGRTAEPIVKPEGFLERAGFKTDLTAPKETISAAPVEVTPRTIDENLKQALELKQMREDYAYKPEGGVLEQLGTGLKRAGMKGALALEQGAGGNIRFLGDMVGADTSKPAAVLEDINKKVEAIGDPGSHPARLVEGAISSIAQQLPGLGLGVVTGSEAIALGNMAMNSFGQTYDDSRRQGLDVGDSTKRSAQYMAAEVIGERFGLKGLMGSLEKAMAGTATKDLSKEIAKYIVSQVPGEQLTYAAQFATDKQFGLNPEAGIQQFLDGAADTFYATLIQGGFMMGGAHTVNQAAKLIKEKNPELSAEEAKKIALDKWKEKGQLAKPLVPSVEPTPEAPTTQQVEQAKEEAAKEAVENPIYQERLNRLVAAGADNAGVNIGSGGAGANLPGQPVDQKLDTGAGEPDRSRVAGTADNVGAIKEGTVSQPAALVSPTGEAFPTNGQAQKFRKENELNDLFTVTKTDDGFVLTPKALKPVEVAPVVTEEAPVVKQEVAPVEVAPLELAPTVEPTPVQKAQANLVEAQRQAKELMPSEEAAVSTAPKAEEVLRTEEAQAAEGRRLEEAYKVKTTEAAKKDQVTEETIDAYDELSKEDKEGKPLPAWNKLNTAEKAVYTSTNKTQGADAAIKALRDFRYDLEGNVNPAKEEDAALYEVNRGTASKEHDLEMPSWQNLSPDAQESFLSALPKLTRKKTAYTGADLHNAFEKVATQLEQEGKGVRGAHEVDIEKAKLRGTEEAAQTRAQAKSEAERAKAAEAVGKGEAISEEVKAKLIAGDVNGVLKDLSSTAKGIKDQYVGREVGRFTYLANVRQEVTQVVNKALAKALDKITFESKVITDPNDAAIKRLQQEGKLAEYNPKTDTFYFTPEGFDESTVLHEIVHAGTVKIINQYFTDPASLTQEQRDAVEHLQKIYDFAKPRLSGKYKNAFENLYEFVAYALTENNFQNALSEIQARKLTKYSKFDEELAFASWEEYSKSLPEEVQNNPQEMDKTKQRYNEMRSNADLNKSLWSKFTQALAGMHGLISEKFEKFSWLMDDVYKIVAKQYFSTKQGMEGLYETVSVDDLDPQQQENFDAAVDKLMASVKTAEEADLLNGIFGELDKNGQMTVGSAADLDKLNRLLSDRIDKEQKEAKAKKPVEAQKTTQVRGEKKLLGGKRGYEGNVLLEISEAFNRILAAPVAGTEVAPLAAKETKKVEGKARTFDQMMDDTKLIMQASVSRLKRIALGFLHPKESYEYLVPRIQNSAAGLKLWENRLQSTGKIESDPNKKFNNAYELLSLAAAKAKALYGQYVTPHEQIMNDALGDLMKAYSYMDPSGKIEYADLVTVLRRAGLYLTGLHEPERRRLMFVTKVPLRNDISITINGVTDSPANFREYIMNALENLKDTPQATATQQAQQLRKVLDAIVFTNPGNLTNPNRDARKGTLNNANIDFAEQLKSPDTFDENSSKYSVVGEYSPEEVDTILGKFNADPNKAKILELNKAIHDMELATIELNKQGNYWSPPVNNRVAFYGFKHYVPFKGRPELAEKRNDGLFTSTEDLRSKDFQFYQGAMQGRTSEADNPVIQVVVDAEKAAFIASHNQVTQAVANAIDQKLINGEQEKRIPFNERFKGLTKEEIAKKNTIFNYKPDGTIEVYSVKDQPILDALRQPYIEHHEATQALLDVSGFINRFMGQGYTRFNPGFAPWNMTRDMVTNLLNVTIEQGPLVASKMLGKTIYNTVIDTVRFGGMISAARDMDMYKQGKFGALKNKAKRDPYTAEFLRMAKRGGVVSYLQGVSNASKLKEMSKNIEHKNWETFKRYATILFDHWFDAFENVVRTSGNSVLVEHFKEQGLSQEAAEIRAAAYNKNLANFEQSGKYGSEMGSLYMFSRPQATGAVRAIDAIKFAFVPVEEEVAKLPEVVRDDPAAVEAFKKDYAEKAFRSRTLQATLIGFGVALYMMSFVASDKDEQGNNIIAMDDKARWTRAARFTIPGTDYVFQIANGFGLGSYIAWGEQIAAYGMGHQTLPEFLSNVATIGLDSYIPVPVSRMPFFESPLMTAKATFDTIWPSSTRPIFEWMINTNGLGQEIKHDMRGKSEAYSGNMAIPEKYRQAADWMNEEFGISLSPDLMYFFVSSYANAFSLVGQNLDNMAGLMSGDREFNAKTDTIVLNSFISNRSDAYSKEFNRVEKEILKMKGNLDAAEKHHRLNEYTAKHPHESSVVEIYNKDVGGTLKELRAARTNIINAGLPQKERDQQLKENKIMQQATKARMVAAYKYYLPQLKTRMDKD